MTKQLRAEGEDEPLARVGLEEPGGEALERAGGLNRHHQRRCEDERGDRGGENLRRQPGPIESGKRR